jgi:hypothetical protein
MGILCENTLAQAFSSEDIVLPILGREILVDRKNHSLRRKNQGEWEPVTHSLLELLVLVYLLQAGPQLLSRELVSAKELKTAHFFQGPHELNVGGVLERFGRDLKGFRRAAEPRISVLFDLSVESHLSADAIWGLVALVSDALLKSPDLPF